MGPKRMIVRKWFGIRHVDSRAQKVIWNVESSLKFVC